MRNSKSGIAFVLFILSFVLILGPFFIEAMSGLAQFITMGFGVFLLLLAIIVWVIAKLYKKTETDTAFVRTGMGGRKVCIDGGIIVIPFMHQLRTVSCETMKLEVTRNGTDALITKDNLRADVKSEFYIKVQKEENDVITAATTLGEKAMRSEDIKKLVEEKLISALRTVGAGQTLTELHINRDEFAAQVHKIVSQDLKHNGLTLESVTISNLDQTPIENMKADSNVFDAQGAKTVAEIVATARIARNKADTNAEKEVKKQDVEKDQFVYEQEITRKKAEEKKNLEIANAQAERVNRAEVYAADQEKNAETAKVKKTEAIETATVEKEKNVELATIERNKAEETARVEKEITVLNKEEEKAKAATKRATEEAKAAEADEKIITAQEKEQAERKRAVEVIGKDSVAQQEKIEKNMTVDVKAYEKRELAKAEKEAAQNEAEAITVKAEANKTAKLKEAEGMKAIQLIPVQVEAERVEVVGKELMYKSTNMKVTMGLEIGLAKIDAFKSIGIAQAEAFGKALQAAKMTIWGDPQAFERISEAFMKGQEKGFQLDGLSESLPANAEIDFVQMLKNYVTGQTQSMFVEGWNDNLPEEVKTMLVGLVKSPGGAALGITTLLKSVLGREPKKEEEVRIEEIVEKVKEALEGEAGLGKHETTSIASVAKTDEASPEKKSGFFRSRGKGTPGAGSKNEK